MPRLSANRRHLVMALARGAPLAAGAVAVTRRPFETLRAAARVRLLLRGAAERTVLVDGLPVRYFAAGRAPNGAMTAPVVVLVPGLGDAAETWARVMPALARHGRVLAPDLAGFGRTPIPREGMHFSVLVAYLAVFLDALGVGRAALVGNSLGGAVAIRYAATHPDHVSHLVLLNSAGLLHNVPAVLTPATRAVAQELVAVSTGSTRRLPGFVLDAFVRQSSRPAQRAYLGGTEVTDVTADLPRVTAPTTLVWGERDRLIPLSHGRRLRDGIAGAELIVLPGVGHLPQADAPDRVVAIVRDRVWPDARRPSRPPGTARRRRVSASDAPSPEALQGTSEG